MSWYECPKCGRELTEEQAYYGRCKHCGDVVVRVRGWNMEGPVDLNKATALELQRIAGFGKGAAENVVRVQKSGRKFVAVEELLKIRGVGKKTYEKVKDRVFV